PAGSPSGGWSVKRVRVTDNAGNVRVVNPVDVPVVQVSRNDVVSATDFALSPPVVDNWRETKVSNLVFRPSGLVGGLTSVDLETVAGCWPDASAPTLHPDGPATVAVQVLSFADQCEISGVAIKDGAGHL